MKKMIYLMVMGIALLQNLQAQTFNANMSLVLQNKLDSLVTSFSPNTKGVAIGIYCPGQGYWNGVSGISHPGTNLTLDMKMGIASNSKLFIAVTLLRLDEENIIDLDNPISNWLAPIPNVNPSITVRQLLNHTSGVFDPFFGTALLDSIEAHPNHVYTTAEVLSMVGAPLFPVGTSYGYSNTNYILAGMVAESATGSTMAELVRNYILTPLSMDNTFYDYAEQEMAPLAHRWHNHLDYNDTSRVSLNSAGGPAGAIFSNASDMAHWYHALMDGQVLSAASFDELTDFISFGAIGNYGLGLQRSTFFNRETWGHGGSTHGYKSRSVYDPCSKFVVCGLSNDDWSAIDAITLLMYKALVDYLPDCSGAITGVNEVCQGTQSVTYTVPPIAHATSYVWTLPNGVTGASVTNSITVDFALFAVSGNIEVKGINQYGEGASSIIAVVVNPIPATPSISIAGNVIHSDAANGNQWYDLSGPIAGENGQDFIFQNDGSYYSIVTLQGCSSDPCGPLNTLEAGISDIDQKEAPEIFPNPAVTTITISLKNSSLSIYEVRALNNQEVMKGTFEQSIDLDLSKLKSGVYFIRVENEATNYLKKIIKL